MPVCSLPFLVGLRFFLIILPVMSSSNILCGTLHGAENTRTCHGNSRQSRETYSYDATVEKGRERNHYVNTDEMRREKHCSPYAAPHHTLVHERCTDSPFFCSKSMEMDSVLPSGERQNSAGGFSASEK